MAWIIDGNNLYPESTGPALTPSVEEAKWQWRVSAFANNGLPYNGYMKTSKVYPVMEPSDYDYIDILDNVKVYSEPHALNAFFPVTEMVIPLSKPENTKYKLGTDKKISLTSVNSAINEEIKRQLLEVPKPSDILTSAQTNAAELINNATNGYVTLKKNDQGFVEELIISDTPDYTQATKVWVWNQGGLGFSNEGYKPEAFKLALTKDGSIVADMITTGVMSADYLRGGHLKIGGLDYTRDAEGNIISIDIDRSDEYVSIVQNGWVEDEYGETHYREIREMSLGGGQVKWDDYSKGHVGHIDSYEGPEGAEYPWLSIVAQGGIMLNPNNLGIMDSYGSDGYFLTKRHQKMHVLDMSASIVEGEDLPSLEVVTDIEIDEETKEIKSIKKKTLKLQPLEFRHGLLISETYDIQ